jgi:hypothetical protein
MFDNISELLKAIRDKKIITLADINAIKGSDGISVYRPNLSAIIKEMYNWVYDEKWNIKCKFETYTKNNKLNICILEIDDIYKIGCCLSLIELQEIKKKILNNPEFNLNQLIINARYEDFQSEKLYKGSFEINFLFDRITMDINTTLVLNEYKLCRLE